MPSTTQYQAVWSATALTATSVAMAYDYIHWQRAGKNMNSLKVWLHGLAAAAVSAFASAASGAIALPAVFTFDKTGLLNMVKLATVPALLAVFAYLKSSPVPALNGDRVS